MAGRQLHGSVRRVGQELAVAGAPGLVLSGAGRHHRHGDRFLFLLLVQPRVAGAGAVVVGTETGGRDSCNGKQRGRSRVTPERPVSIGRSRVFANSLRFSVLRMIPGFLRFRGLDIFTRNDTGLLGLLRNVNQRCVQKTKRATCFNYARLMRISSMYDAFD